MGRGRDAARWVRATVRVVRRRRVRGPLRPGWPMAYEAVLEMLRERFHTSTAPLPVVRDRMASLGRGELRRRRATFERVTIADRPAEWVVPPAHDDRVVLYLHGGGYAFGSFASHRALIVDLARACRARVLGLDYRLAPEHPCPAAIEDVVAAWRALLARGVAPGRAVLGGDSAGGGLAVATLVALREAGLPLPAGAVLLSPWVDLEVTGASTAEFAQVDYLGTQDTLRAFARHYAGALDPRDPRVSPLHADLAGLPPLHISVGGAEVLRDDAVRLAASARAAGVPVTLSMAPEEVHVFPVFSSLSPAARGAVREIGSFVVGVTGGPAGLRAGGPAGKIGS